MGKLIAVVGNSGVGKTTFARVLCRQADLVSGLEQHAGRPFQEAFALDLQKYALANQVDYLLLRAEQELAIRRSSGTGVLDGGLDLDFFVFTRHFYRKGYLAEKEYRLCARIYAFFRELLPPPDLICRLTAPVEIVSERYARRNRSLEIAGLQDLAAMEILLDDWIAGITETPVLTIDASQDDPEYTSILPRLARQIKTLLNVNSG
jgi:deoxyadenosine/deoxycytidine kinase